ncbi:DUF3313 domain-containing protein [Achromobacter aloeverae]|uniref:DUF3313 domain-containing protein n=1 Tax=Achromobacter aloeverae TaxID=1750518 RepID=A0A4V1MSK8_9BURK|nr:DUF3313 domain-containing protein [Achromobacter aloeverae]RXN92390.1 DUF3313 domain-containing protein [Achromobacter aloeverae]
MKAHFLRKSLLSMSAVLLVAGCASEPPTRESGFLGDYSRLEKQDAPGGGTRLAYVNPTFTPANYTALWLDPVVFYPEPKPTENVSMATMNQVREYMDQALRSRLDGKVRMVNHAGPGVAHARLAITAVGAETEALAPYQYIPIALVVTGAKAAIEGGRPQEATLAIEAQVSDSQTGKLLFASVRGGTGGEVRSASQGQGAVQPEQLKKLIDTWADGAAAQVSRYIKTF